jgi:hypothetical protein
MRNPGELVAILAPMLLGAAVIYFIFVLPTQLRGRERSRLYDLLKHGYDKGQPVPSELIRELMRKPMPTRERDIRWGALILSLAVGLALFGATMVTLWQIGVFEQTNTWTDDHGVSRTVPDYDERNTGLMFLMLAIMPACVGFTFLMLGLTKRRDDT